jgi:hypothetical protein
MKKALLFLLVITGAIGVKAVTVKLKLLNCPGEVHLSGPLHPWAGVQLDNLNVTWQSNLVTYYTNGEAFYTIPRITNQCLIDLRFPNVCWWHKDAYPGGWTNAYVWDDATPTPHTNWLTIGSNYVGGRWTVTASGSTFTVTPSTRYEINSASVLEPNKIALTYGHLDVKPRQITIDSDPNGRLQVYWQTNLANTFTTNITLPILDRQGHSTFEVSDNAAIPRAFYKGVLTWTNQFP